MLSVLFDFFAVCHCKRAGCKLQSACACVWAQWFNNWAENQNTSHFW